jgi:hypothetical protein
VERHLPGGSGRWPCRCRRGRRRGPSGGEAERQADVPPPTITSAGRSSPVPPRRRVTDRDEETRSEAPPSHDPRPTPSLCAAAVDHATAREVEWPDRAGRTLGYGPQPPWGAAPC